MAEVSPVSEGRIAAPELSTDETEPAASVVRNPRPSPSDGVTPKIA